VKKYLSGVKYQDIPEEKRHQYRPCTVCSNYSHWRQMKAENKTICTDQDAEKRADTSYEKSDVTSGKQYSGWEYTCQICHAWKLGVTVPEARRDIIQKRTQKGIDRCKKYECALLAIQSDWSFLLIETKDDDVKSVASTATGGYPASSASAETEWEAASPASGMAETTSLPGGVQFTSKRQMKKAMRKEAVIKAASMKKIFAPIAHILALKETDMDKAVRAARRLQKHLNNEPFTDEEKDEETAMQLEIQYEGTLYKERAFADHEDKDRMRAVADYSDRWFALDSGMGFFNVYYVCKAGAALWPCNTLIISQEWDRLHQDMTATKQRWYCKECAAKYKVRYGVIVEITIGNRAFYAAAELPPWDIQDAKLMKIAEDYEQYKTPEELLAALPKIMPLDKKQFLTPTKNAGHFKFKADMLKNLPIFEWSQMYNFRGLEDLTGDCQPREIPDDSCDEC
jgi:hypothetical protein